MTVAKKSMISNSSSKKITTKKSPKAVKPVAAAEKLATTFVGS